MKKTYMMPAVQVSEAEAENMMALSLLNINADRDGDVLVKPYRGWEIWDDAEAE